MKSPYNIASPEKKGVLLISGSLPAARQACAFEGSKINIYEISFPIRSSYDFKTGTPPFPVGSEMYEQ